MIREILEEPGYTVLEAARTRDEALRTVTTDRAHRPPADRRGDAAA